MDPITVIDGAVSVARPRRRRHRPDHPQAVPQARRAHRLRRVPLLRLGQGAAAGTCRRTRSSSTGRNFGCGSSREHAPWALEDYGFKAIVAPSLRRHLLRELDQDRAAADPAAGRRRQGGHGRRRARRSTSTPRRSRCDGGSARFEIDPDVKHRLLNGLDEIGADAAEGGRDRRLRGRPRALRPGHDGALTRPHGEDDRHPARRRDRPRGHAPRPSRRCTRSATT